jgi:hypothetical protein
MAYILSVEAKRRGRIKKSNENGGYSRLKSRYGK